MAGFTTRLRRCTTLPVVQRAEIVQHTCSTNVSAVTAMTWTRPKELPPLPTRYGEPYQNSNKPREALSPGFRCGLCDERDPDVYSRCTRRVCFPEPIPVVPRTAAQAGFTAPARLISSFTLAARMRAKADSLPWEADEERGRLLMRARELVNGEPEVPEEDF